MTKEDIIRKLTSRKFILALAMFVFSILCLTGVIPIEVQESWKYIAIGGATIIAYIVGEGATDIFSMLFKNKEDAEEYEEYEEGEEE